MQSTNSKYGLPYLATCHFHFSLLNSSEERISHRFGTTVSLRQLYYYLNIYQIILPKYIIKLYYQIPYFMSIKMVCLFRKNVFTIKKNSTRHKKGNRYASSFIVASKFYECLLQELLSPSLYNRDQANHSVHTFRPDFVWADTPEEWGSWCLCCCWCCSALFSWLQVVGSDLTLCTSMQWPQ